MKNYYTLFLSMFCACVFAQTNVDIENAKWVNSFYDLIFQGTNRPPVEKLSFTKKYCTSTDDTVLNNNTYLKLIDCGEPSPIYKGAIRVDGDRWFFWEKDSTNEMLLYDFSLKSGDTLKEAFYTEGLAWHPQVYPYNVVDFVDTVMINGIPRRHIYLNMVAAPWIEGIGCAQGLLWDPYGNISMFNLALDCFSKNNLVAYNSGRPDVVNLISECNMSLSLSDRVELEGSSVYPNPSSGTFTFSLPRFTSRGSLKIYDVTGALMHTQIIKQQYTEMQLNLKSGAYLLHYEEISAKASLQFIVE